MGAAAALTAPFTGSCRPKTANARIMSPMPPRSSAIHDNERGATGARVAPRPASLLVGKCLEERRKRPQEAEE